MAQFFHVNCKCCIPKEENKPHVVTPEMLAQANELKAECEASGKLCEELFAKARDLEVMARKIAAANRLKNDKANELLLGPGFEVHRNGY